MEKTTLYLPEALQRRLREAARQEGRPQAELVREAVESYLAGRSRRLPKSMGALRQDPDKGQRVDARDAKHWVRQRWDDEWRRQREERESPR